MASHTILPETLHFLNDLRRNNRREWFNQNKDRYEIAYENMQQFTEGLMSEMQKHDHLVPRSPKKTLFRIYRDIRFSKDKTPYKMAFSGSLKRATKLLRGGYYFRIAPGDASMIAGGFWGPNRDDLLRIRRELEIDASEMRSILSHPKFKRNFGDLEGNEVKTAPRGFSIDHPDIDLIRKKQFLLTRNFTDEQVLSPYFVRSAVSTYLAMRPFFNYMSQVLTTDENGVPIV